MMIVMQIPVAEHDHVSHHLKDALIVDPWCHVFPCFGEIVVKLIQMLATKKPHGTGSSHRATIMAQWNGKVKFGIPKPSPWCHHYECLRVIAPNERWFSARFSSQSWESEIISLHLERFAHQPVASDFYMYMYTSWKGKMAQSRSAAWYLSK